MSSKKRHWRKLYNVTDQPDLSAVLVNRAKEKCLYTLNSAGLNRSSRWNQRVKHYVDNPANSQYTVRAIEKIRRQLRNNERPKDKQECQQSATSISDIVNQWDSSVQKNESKQVKSVPVQSAESVSPYQPDYQDVIVKQASGYMKQENQRRVNKLRLLRPMTCILEQRLQNSALVNRLTALQKQKVIVFSETIRSLLDRGDSSIDYETYRKLLCDYARDVLDNKSDAHVQVYQHYGIQQSMETEQIFEKLGIRRKKTKQQRTRFRSHSLRLRQYTEDKKQKQFYASFDRIKAFWKELEATNTKTSKPKHKVKKKSSSALPSDIYLLPSEHEHAQGSIRKLKLSSLSGIALRNQVSTVYNHPLISMNKSLTTSSLARFKKHMRKQHRSHRAIIK